MTVGDHQEINNHYSKRFVKHRDKSAKVNYDPDLIDRFYVDNDAVDTGYRNNRAIYGSR